MPWYDMPLERLREYRTDTSGASAPVVVKFIGYGGGRGAPSEHMLLPALGCALLVMHSRGRGD